jgi:hypothetical protein
VLAGVAVYGAEVGVAGSGVAVGSWGSSVSSRDGVMVTSTAWLVRVTRACPEVARGVQTIMVESRGGKVGIAPQEASISAAKLIKMIPVYFLIKLSLF